MPDNKASNPTSQVTFLIGPFEIPFLVHHEIASNASPIFFAALEKTNKNSFQGKSQIYKLPNTSAAAFRLSMQWMYSLRFTIIQLMWPEDKAEIADFEAKAKEEDEALIELWILGDKLLMPSMQNDILFDIDEINSIVQKDLLYGLQYLMEHTDEKSPLRRYFVENVAWSYDMKALKKIEDLPKNFLLEVAAYAMEKMQDDDRLLTREDYRDRRLRDADSRSPSPFYAGRYIRGRSHINSFMVEILG
jgi:hypothetical protein